MPTLTFGRVPFPGYLDHQAMTANKPEGMGWDNISLWGDSHRTPMFLVIHRMYGTLAGTDSPNWFGSPTVGALTDYGVGTANIDGPALDGVIVQWNDPRGYRVPWASGPVSAPYGDAVKWLNWSGNKWGYSICNACGVSVENSGKWDDPMTDVAFGELAKLVAYWFDQFGVAHDTAPIHPQTGISAITWHQEWTIGTGKVCPGDWLMQNTQRLIDAAAAIMKPYQTGQTAGEPAPQPDPKPAPAPQYAKPVPIPELVPFTAKDKDSAKAVVSRGETDFVWVNDTVKAVRDTPRLQLAMQDAKRTGPDIKSGEQFDVLWECTAADGQHYYISGYWTRIKVADTERIKD
jgi:hypothetical protein